ncbi:MAG: Methyl-accepting chemotaxis sensory transducer with Cache sensor [Candidatus Woesebacteria bacterium GW2011_GWA1_41_7]|uniref:Methyl-accepting chemotaxis sensory transducer with Cache sensor n=1 Tax=Candidatus Woesebacteria bacterium GW2011_GWA1_41_7 TaxID=1618556 RepID=A0A0G0ZZL2_9BACT|nr:MAG: Methyl-accepting chemotaxis sensory transducer with Cache sensor [Candidatus Woesebacteria bacterium GW2011_GWA1_41_7]
MPKSIYTVKEVAELLGFSTNTVYKYLDDGSIKAVRLGTEGRFRIPASEVDKLLQERGGNPQKMKVTSFDQGQEFPGVFDWFIGFLSIGIGLSQFIYPIYFFTNANLAGIAPFVDVICVLLLISGILLLGFDIFNIGKNNRRSSLDIIIGVLYLILTGIFVFQNYVVAFGYLSLSLILLMSALKKISSYSRYLIFINVLCFLVGVAYILSPESLRALNISAITAFSKNTYIFIWMIFFGLVLLSSYLAYRKNIVFIRLIAVIVGITSFVYAILSFTGGFWGSAVFGIILGSFSMIFPVTDRFDFFRNRNKKESAIGFVWLVVIFLTGSLILRAIHVSLQRSVLAEMENEAETASVITKDFIDRNISILKTSVESGDLANALSEGGAVGDLDRELKKMFLLSNNFFARVIVTDNHGKVLDTYPFYLQSQNVDLSDRDHFIQPAVTGDIYISGLIQPKSSGVSPSVLISSPIFDNNDKFLGVAIASVNLLELQKQLKRAGSDETGMLSLVDSQGNYVLNPGLQKTITSALSEKSGDTSARRVGLTVDYNSDGILEFRASKEVEEYGWKVFVTKPRSMAMKTYSSMGFGIFLFFMMFTTGSLIFAVYLRTEGVNRRIEIN